MSMTYKQDLRDIAVAVAQNSKAYTDKKIEDFRWELGTYDLSVDTINGTTMLLPSPSGTIQATMVEIDGASEVSENLIVLNDVAETTVNGITYSVSGGIISIKGTATAQVNIELNINKTYSAGSYNYKVFNWTTGLGIDYFISNQNYAFDFYNTSGGSQSVKSMTFSGEELLRKAYFQIANGTAISGTLQLKPMLVKGTTAPTEFKVGYEGIHNLELSGLVVKNSDDEVMQTKTIDLSTILYNGSPLFEGNSLKGVGTAKDYITPYKATKIMTTYTFSNNPEVYTRSVGGTLNGFQVVVNNSVWKNGTSNSIGNFDVEVGDSYSSEHYSLATNRFNISFNASRGIDTVEKAKEYIANKTIVFELNTHIEVSIDFSQLVKFEAYSNGSITLVNTNNQDTTSTFKYLKEVAK